MRTIARTPASRVGTRPTPRAATYFTDAAALNRAFDNPPTVILGPGEPQMAHQTDEYCELERVREAALLRALGATQAQLSRAAWIEFGLLGLLAGLLAALGASLIGQVAARLVFDFSLGFNPAVFVIGGVAGIVITLLAAVLGLRRVLRQAPMLSLREA